VEKTDFDIFALEVLDAAGQEVPADRVEATAVILKARGVLRFAATVRVLTAGREGAGSDDLLRGLLDAADAGLVRRYRGAYRLTSAGLEALEEHGRAGAPARKAGAELAAMQPSALWAEANRSMPTT
jgi:hypothetical protein